MLEVRSVESGQCTISCRQWIFIGLDLYADTLRGYGTGSAGEYLVQGGADGGAIGRAEAGGRCCHRYEPTLTQSYGWVCSRIGRWI